MASPVQVLLVCERPTCEQTTEPEQALAAGWTVLPDRNGKARAWCPVHGL